MSLIDYHQQFEPSLRFVPVDFGVCRGTKGEGMFPPHWHEKLEILSIQSGGMRVLLDREFYSVQAGDIVFVNPGVVHCGVCGAGEVEYSYVIVDLRIFLGSNMDEADREILNLQRGVCRVSPVIRADRELREQLEQAAVWQRMPVQEYGMMAKAGLMLAVSSALFRYKDKKAPLAARCELAGLEQALDVIHQNYQKDITLSELAGCTGFSASYFCKYFKKAMGQTPTEYLNMVRVHKAYEMLVYTALSVTEISTAVGFSSLNHFNRQFKGCLGLSPSDVREFTGLEQTVQAQNFG